jgi:phosphomannomutase / phosphoglucomutase
VHVADMTDRYIEDLAKGGKISRRLKVVAACGNGTAGAFAPRALEAIGCEVVPLDCDLDFTFPHYNPNPEDMEMLHAMSAKVKATGADVGLGFDGDGDRCGVVDNNGDEIFADKVGVMLARDMSTLHPGATFVVDVKSTGLFATDPVLKKNGAKTDYWKTGHSYMKRRTNELGAIAGFEKSGHYFLRPPFGLGYDDLPKTWGSPTMSPHCADEKKYGIVEKATAHFQKLAKAGASLAGQKIANLVTVNGVRVTLADGTWGLVRASSNKPELVVVCESPVSDKQMRAMFAEIDGHLKTYPEVGEYNQKI